MQTPFSQHITPSPLRDVRDFFFDLDGTLADSLTGLHGSIQAAFASVGRPLPVSDLRPYIGPGIRTILHRLDTTLTEDHISTMEQAFRADYDDFGVLRTEMFSGVEHLLQTLHGAGKRLFLVTNKPRLATGRLLAKHSLAHLFTVIVSRDSRDPAFPTKGEMLRETARHAAAQPATSVMVGDTEEDAAAAREAGMRFVHAAYGYGTCTGEMHLVLTQVSALHQLCGLPDPPPTSARQPAAQENHR